MDLPANAPSLLFVTRKYPPGRGGMEEFAARLFAAYPGPKRLVALRHGQALVPLLVAGAVVAAARGRGRVELVHLGDALLTPLAPLLGRLADAPVTATLHGLDTVRGLPGYRALLGVALRRMSGRLVAVSDYTAARAATIHGVQPATITNGVDVARFAAIRRTADPAACTRLGLPPSGPLVVTTGRLVRRKGVAWFITRVLPLLDPAVTYAVAGDGPDRRAVQAAAAAAPGVVLLGPVSDATLAELYARADLFVAPNIPVADQPEGYGIAPAEAAAAGLAVVVSELEGLRDMARDTGVPMAPAGDAAAWAAAVRAALADPASYRAKRPPRSWEEVAGDYARFFAGVRAARGELSLPRP